METAKDIIKWPVKFKPEDWPGNTLQHMSRELFIRGVFPLRAESGIPMWPSQLAAAHVREDGKSQHSTNFYTRLSQATDMHVKSYENLISIMAVADKMELIGGIGLYFDTHTPMFHIDMRKDKLMWIRTKAGKYIYRENNHIEFYIELGKELQLTN